MARQGGSHPLSNYDAVRSFLCVYGVICPPLCRTCQESFFTMWGNSLCCCDCAGFIHQRQQQRSIGQHGECKITYPFRNQIIRFAVYSLSAHVIKLTGKRIPSLLFVLLCPFQALLFASLALGFQLFPFLAGGFWCFRCPVINTQLFTRLIKSSPSPAPH